MMAEGVLLDGWDDGGSGGMAIVSVSVRMFMLSICCGSHKPQVICRRPPCLVLPAVCVLQEFQHRCPAAGLLAGIAVDNFF